MNKFKQVGNKNERKEICIFGINFAIQGNEAKSKKCMLNISPVFLKLGL